MAGQNRASRRAAARENGTLKSAADIPMAQPDRDLPKARTLMDIAEEKRRELMEKHPEAFPPEDREMLSAEERDFFSNQPLGAFGEALVYTVSLSMLHFTLDVLVFNQYRQEIEFREIFGHLGRVIPALFCVVYLLHTQTAHGFPLLKQFFFFVASGVAGSYLIYSGNKSGYYAVMQKAPPLGTIWVWCVVEMGLWWALAHLGVVGGYTWWNGFTAF